MSPNDSQYTNGNDQNLATFDSKDFNCFFNDFDQQTVKIVLRDDLYFLPNKFYRIKVFVKNDVLPSSVELLIILKKKFSPTVFA